MYSYSIVTTIALVLLSLVGQSFSFSVLPSMVVRRQVVALSQPVSIRSSSVLYMSEEDSNEKPFGKKTEENPELKFDMNKRVRLGRSRDQDGKSNIWSIEPTMEVEEEGEDNAGQKNLIIAGAVIGTAVACLPLFNLFSKLFPDPSDF